MIRIAESINLTVAQNVVYGTYLCGQTSGGCAECHPSCNSCDVSFSCDFCKDPNAGNTFQYVSCLCGNSYGTTGDEYHANCGPCDLQCSSCWKAQDPNQCMSCFFSGTQYSGGKTIVSSCICPPGYVTMKADVADPCTTPCTDCLYCLSSDSTDCFDTQEQVLLTAYIPINFQDLPLTTETEDHKWCYLQRRLESNTEECTKDPLEAVVTGDITDYSAGSGATFEPSQCKQLLRAQLPFAQYWFNRLFPHFSLPSVTDSQRYWMVKGGLYLYILSIGPDVMQTEEWDGLRDLINSASTDWTQVLAWLTPTPSYLTNGSSSSTKPLPQSLVDWMSSPGVCSPYNCPYFWLFNAHSRVCKNPDCDVKSICEEFDAKDACAVSGKDS